MSFHALAWATRQQAGSAQAKCLLLILANHINQDTGLCNPSLATLGQSCEMSVSSVKKFLRQLESRGLIRRISGSRTESNRYELVIKEVGRSTPNVGRDTPKGRAQYAQPVGRSLPTNLEVEPGSKTILKKSSSYKPSEAPRSGMPASIRDVLLDSGLLTRR